jgi:hypothetical protein
LVSLSGIVTRKRATATTRISDGIRSQETPPILDSLLGPGLAYLEIRSLTEAEAAEAAEAQAQEDPLVLGNDARKRPDNQQSQSLPISTTSLVFSDSLSNLAEI